jgi:hypothetical protein
MGGVSGMEDYEYQHNNSEDGIEHVNQESIICPYCGHDYGYDESSRMPGNTTNAWKFDVECQICGNMFSCSWDFSCVEGGGIEYTTWHEKQELFS